MGFFSDLFGIVKKIVPLLQKGIDLAKKNGLSDATIQQALKLVKTAATKFADNDERRAWVLKVLMDHKISEGGARIAIEIAVQLLKNSTQEPSAKSSS
jgi:hypothetical protein